MVDLFCGEQECLDLFARQPQLSVCSSPASFTLFSLLPKELQLKIWASVSLPSRLITVTECTFQSHHIVHRPRGPAASPYGLNAHCTVPPLLHTCASSRFVALKQYTQAFELPIFVNFECDIFYFPSAGIGSRRFPVIVENHNDVEQVRRIVGLGSEEWPTLEWLLLVHRVFSGLEGVFMVRHELGRSKSAGEGKMDRDLMRNREMKRFEMLAKGSAAMIPNISLSGRKVGDLSKTKFELMFENEFQDLIDGK